MMLYSDAFEMETNDFGYKRQAIDEEIHNGKKDRS